MVDLPDVTRGVPNRRANTPSKQSISKWLDAVFMSPLESDNTISANHYEMSNSYDTGVSREAEFVVGE